MHRVILEHLKAWKDDPARLPLLVRGARQVGKSYVVDQFGKQYFDNIVTVNFELQPECAQAFQSLNPINICNTLSLLLNQPIDPSRTLLFLDEIQETPEAIQSLRYFKEQMPELHVIAAGSLLEFALNGEDFRMPVGRVQSFYMGPLTFNEFLIASKHEQLAAYLHEATVKTGIEPALHTHLLSLLKQYFISGGMPASVSRFINTQNLSKCQEVQANILNDYRNDFGKYAKRAKIKYLQKVFERAPGLSTKHFKYVDIDPDMASRDLKEAIGCLQDAGLLRQIFFSKANGLPLNAQLVEKKYKMLFLDVGLVQYKSKLAADILLEKDLLLLNRGQIAEQFVGQELLMLREIYEPGELYYWEAESYNQTAEVDYLININANIVPIEVKAGVTGTLKSLKRFIQEKKCDYGVRLSQRPLALEGNILTVPLYMINELPRIYKTL